MKLREDQSTSINIYLIRAIREWAMDNGLTPQLLVDANVEGVAVPVQYVEDGKVVLNVDDQAVRSLEFSDEWISFSARFRGVSYAIDLPIQSILAIFSRETHQGIYFQQSVDDYSGENTNAEVEPVSAIENHKSITNEQQSALTRRHLRLVE